MVTSSERRKPSFRAILQRASGEQDDCAWRRQNKAGLQSREAQRQQPRWYNSGRGKQSRWLIGCSASLISLHILVRRLARVARWLKAVRFWRNLARGPQCLTSRVLRVCHPTPPPPPPPLHRALVEAIRALYRGNTPRAATATEPAARPRLPHNGACANTAVRPRSSWAPSHSTPLTSTPTTHRRQLTASTSRSASRGDTLCQHRRELAAPIAGRSTVSARNAALGALSAPHEPTGRATREWRAQHR